MSSKIEVSRELAERLTRGKPGSSWDALADDRLDATEELRAILAAPVVERQPDAYIVQAFDEDGHLRSRSLHWQALEVFKDMRDYKEWIGVLRAQETPLYTAPPELAELQATIERLTAENERLTDELSACTTAPGGCSYWRESARLRTQENERLKGGQVEPVAFPGYPPVPEDRKIPADAGGYDDGAPCPECGSRDCNGQCFGDDMTGDS